MCIPLTTAAISEALCRVFCFVGLVEGRFTRPLFRPNSISYRRLIPDEYCVRTLNIIHSFHAQLSPPLMRSGIAEDFGFAVRAVNATIQFHS